MERRQLLILTLLGSTLVSMILAILVNTGIVAVWHLVVLSLMSGVITSFNHPARQSILPNLVKKEHLLNAISLDSASVQASRIVATPFAGYLIAGYGVVPVFGVRAVGALLAICWLLFVKVRLQPPHDMTKAPWRNVIEGFKYVRGDVLLFSLLPLYLIPMLTQNTTFNFLPIFARDILKIGASGYGFLQAAPGLGALVSLIALAALPFHRLNGSLLFITSGILGIVLVLFSASHWTGPSLLLMVIIGGMITTFMTINTALIQNHISDAMRGRVMSLRELAMGLGPAWSLIFGYIGEETSVPFALGLLGALCIAVSISLFFLLSEVRVSRV